MHALIPVKTSVRITVNTTLKMGMKALHQRWGFDGSGSNRSTDAREPPSLLSVEVLPPSRRDFRSYLHPRAMQHRTNL